MRTDRPSALSCDQSLRPTATIKMGAPRSAQRVAFGRLFFQHNEPLILPTHAHGRQLRLVGQPRNIQQQRRAARASRD